MAYKFPWWPQVPTLKKWLDAVFSPSAGHDHDGVNSKLLAAVVADGSVTDAKLAADVKIGSLEALDTTEKGSVVGAVNEVAAAAAAAQGTADAAYVAPEGGIPEEDLDEAAQAKLNAQATVVTALAAGLTLFGKRIRLNGANPTPVVFQADTPASLLGSVEGPFNIAHGATLVVDPDGAGDVTATWQATAGTSVGDANPSTNMTAEADTKLNVAVDGGDAQEATCDWTGANTGELVAAAVQAGICALGGAFAAVTVAFDADHYVVTSGTKGTGSAVVISAAANGSCTEELKLGEAAGGTETAGTGDAVNTAAATAEEVAAKLNALEGLSAEAEGAKVRITSDTAGRGSSLVVNAASTMDDTLGLSGSAYGAQGMGLERDMADANYLVQVTRIGAGAVADADVAAGGLATTGLNVYCEKAADDGYVDVWVLGELAEG